MSGMNGAEGAIEKMSGPCVIIAGAGTGKTHTIVQKVVKMVRDGIYSPDKIVCITFSNEAANNLLSRIERAIGEGVGLPVVKTFHAFSAELLKNNGDKIGISKEFKIIDDEEIKVLLHSYFKVKPYLCHRYASSISSAKDLGVTIEALEGFVENLEIKYSGVDLEKHSENIQLQLHTLHLNEDKKLRAKLNDELDEAKRALQLRKFVNIWKAYEKLKVKQSYLDYADLNRFSLQLLDKCPEIIDKYNYLIVDEFQDTNKVQLDFIEKFAKHRNITIVGDANQSIYRFRGAYSNTFAEFVKLFNVSDNEIFRLDKSFRSPDSVLNVAHRLVLHNYDDPDSCLFVRNVHNRAGEKVQVCSVKNAREEARKIAEIIESERKRGVRYEEMCVLFRTHQQGALFRKYFESSGIPYSSVSRQSLLKSSNIKLVIDYLQILFLIDKKKKGGEQAWWDLFYQMDFVENDLVILGKFIKDNLKENCLSELIVSKLEGLNLSTSGKLSVKIVLDRLNILGQLISGEVVDLIKTIYRICGFYDENTIDEDKIALLNLDKFLELAKRHNSLYTSDLESFLYYLEILGNLEIEVPAAELVSEGVRLMTLHATKGLEFNTVIVSNLAQGRFPYGRVVSYSLIPPELLPELAPYLEKFSDEEKAEVIRNHEIKHHLLEERRLCYVAFTRAKERLFLTFAREYAGKEHAASQFLFEVGYRESPFIEYIVDEQVKAQESKIVDTKPSFVSALNLSSDSFGNYLISAVKSGERGVKTINPKNKEFSPSALLLFAECQKQYEYKYVYNMPEQKTISWEAIQLGSFVHHILDEGVKKQFSTLEQFMSYARELHLNEDWTSVNFAEAEQLIKVFFERNKNKYNDKTLTEQQLKAVIEGLKFNGFADRIDFHSDGIEIIDYKTGAMPVAPKHRDWQLGYYAIAASSFGRVKRVTLEMLKQDKPLSFEIDASGNAKSVNSSRMSFNVNEVRDEIVKTAKEIVEAYKSGFKPCSIEKHCSFCDEFVYRL